MNLRKKTSTYFFLFNAGHHTFYFTGVSLSSISLAFRQNCFPYYGATKVITFLKPPKLF